jgi:hypothetical protein
MAKQKGSGFFVSTKMYPTTTAKYEKSITVNTQTEKEPRVEKYQWPSSHTE